MNVVNRRALARCLSDFETAQTVELRSSKFVGYLLTLYAVSVVAMVLGHFLPPVLTVPLVVFSLSFVPGSLLMLNLCGRDVDVDAAHILYAFGSSLLFLMFVGVLSNLLLPKFGVTKPLMPLPLGAAITVGVGLVAAISLWHEQETTVRLRVPPLWSPVPLALLSLPFLSIVGVNLVNATGFNVLLIIALVAVGVVPFLTVRRIDERWHSLAIWIVALAVLYHKSLWQFAGFSGRPHGIVAWEAGRWSPGVVSIEQYSSELVQNGVLFPLYARLSDIFILTQYEVVNPLFVSFIPVAMFIAFRQYVRSDIAILGAATFVFVHPFYYQYPTAGRAATPVLFLALFGVALSNRNLSAGARAALAVVFLTGLVVSHYGTSYYVASAFILTLVLLYSLRLFDKAVGDRLKGPSHAFDGGRTIVKQVSPSRSAIFSATTVVFFFSAALGWYLYTRQGWKFQMLPKHAYDNLNTLIGSPSVSGRTTARVTESYSSLSIEISKYIYIGLAVLMLIGLAIAYYRRLFGQGQSFDDHYLAIAGSLFCIFGLTVVLRNWGGGRPMMITFSFTTVFAVLGAVWASNGVRYVTTRVRARLDDRPTVGSSGLDVVPGDRSVAAYGFAAVMCLFLILNTGVASATVLDGLAPSNVPGQESLVTGDGPRSQTKVHQETDIVTHVWFVSHLDTRYRVYADTYGARQFDFYRPDIVARTPEVGGEYPVGSKPQVFDTAKQQEGAQVGYLMLLGHNLELDGLWPSKFSSPVGLETIHLEERNIVYTNGKSRIYLSPQANHPVGSDDMRDIQPTLCQANIKIRSGGVIGT